MVRSDKGHGELGTLEREEGEQYDVQYMRYAVGAMPSIEYMVRNAQHATHRRLFLLEKTKRRVTAQRTLFLFPFSVLRLAMRSMRTLSVAVVRE